MDGVAIVTLSETDADIFAAYQDEIREATPCSWELLIPEEPCPVAAAWQITIRLRCLGGARMAPQVAGQLIYACEDHMTRLLTARANPSQALRCGGCGAVSQLVHIAVTWERIRG